MVDLHCSYVRRSQRASSIRVLGHRHPPTALIPPPSSVHTLLTQVQKQESDGRMDVLLQPFFQQVSNLADPFVEGQVGMPSTCRVELVGK